jgi:hypothetical protein
VLKKDNKMLRVFMWLTFWAATLFTIEIEVQYGDGLRIHLKSWPNALRDYFSKNKEGA